MNSVIRLTDDFVDTYKSQNPNWGFNGLGWVIYKRTYARPILDESGKLIRSEDWWETVERVVNGASEIGSDLTESEMESLYDHIFNLRGTLAGRMLWQMGTDNVTRLGASSMVNCWAVQIQDVSDFGWMFETLMLGGGVGFTVTNPEVLGVVRQGMVEHQPEAHDSDFIVPDKREGWADLLMRTIRCYLPKRDTDYDAFSYSTAVIRPEGAPIKTFGGVASGPGILVDGIEKITEILDKAVGRTLTSVEVLDICNLIGGVVVSGNVRRSAQIAVGDPTDLGFLGAKRWDLGNIPAHRAMSNNSVNIESLDELPPEFWEGYHGNGEAYGLVNVAAARKWGRTGEERNDPSIVGPNPCAEIFLGHRESCNLTELYLPNIESEEQLKEIAGLLYKVQKAVAKLPFLDPVSEAIAHKNMRLGIGVTGIAQSLDKLDWLSPTYDFLRKLDKEWSALKGYPESVRLTTVKPSGSLSLLPGVTPGVHPGYSQFHIRRVRFAASDPLFPWCQQRGYKWEFAQDYEGNDDPRTVIVEFPAAFPDGTLLSNEMSAIDLMELQARLQREWADNAVSISVYYKVEELPEIQVYLKENWDNIKSVSFLLKNDHGFNQAPLEEITESQYGSMLARLQAVSSATVTGMSELDLDDGCDSGMCPIR